MVFSFWKTFLLCLKSKKSTDIHMLTCAYSHTELLPIGSFLRWLQQSGQSQAGTRNPELSPDLLCTGKGPKHAVGSWVKSGAWT